MFVFYLGIKDKESTVRQKFKQMGIPIHFLPVQYYRAFPEVVVRQSLVQLPENGWMTLSSAFTVKLIKNYHLSRQIQLANRPIAIVGESTRKALKQYFPRISPAVIASHFQQLLNKISQSADTLQRVIHLTSAQSFANIQPHLPENILLQRIPVYQLMVNRDLKVSRVKMPQHSPVLWVVPSPSAINAAVELWGTGILDKVTLMVTPGKTTADYLVQHYHFLRIRFPEQPDLTHVIKEVASILQAHPVKEAP